MSDDVQPQAGPSGAAAGRQRPAGRGKGRPKGKAAAPDGAACLVCCGPDSRENLRYVTKGLQKLLASSRVRRDRRMQSALKQILQEKEGAWLHEPCRAAYNNPRTVEAARRQAGREGPVLRSMPDGSIYDPHTQCIICGQTADHATNKKLPQDRRKEPVYLVQKADKDRETDFSQSLEDAVVERGTEDAWANAVRARCEIVRWDLVAAEVRYHKYCGARFIYNGRDQLQGNDGGRPAGTADKEKEAAFLGLINHIDNSDECQYTMADLEGILNDFGAEQYSRRRLKDKLLDYYKDQIVVTHVSGGNDIFNFPSCMSDIHKTWYEYNKSGFDKKNELVRTAAQLIVEEIRKEVFSMDYYPGPKEISNPKLPALLQSFLDNVITSKSADQHGVQLRRHTVGQTIMYNCRPRSYLPPIILGHSIDMHHYEASRARIDMMQKLGLCVSYDETRRFEFSLMVHAESQQNAEEDVQEERPHHNFIWDNADWTTRTLDGKGTFHQTAGARTTTPARRTPIGPIPRLPLPATAEEIAAACTNAAPIHLYEKPKLNGLFGVPVRPVRTTITASAEDNPSALRALTLDTLWMAGRWAAAPRAPSWNGYMQAAMQPEGAAHVTSSSVEILPFIGLNAENLSALFSALLFSIKDSRKKGQEQCCVTLDQPLYTKAARMVASDTSGQLEGITVRLGGFHMTMSFLGAIGYLMRGSGLEDLLAEVYAPNSAVHMLKGHDYARSLRALFLAQEALGGLLLDGLQLDVGVVRDAHQLLLSGAMTAEEACAAAPTRDLWTSLAQRGESLARQSRTARLWWLFFRLVGIVRLFIRAERLADWALHLECVRAMLPIFHAAGHFPYAKAAHLYVQQMEDLDGPMAEAMKKGLFTCRRTQHLWGCVWLDLVIEQDVMRPLKVKGGLTRAGRGLSDSVVSQWVAAMPSKLQITAAMEELTGVRRASSAQHKELRASREKQDKEDLAKFTAWLKAHPPFDTSRDGLQCIATGVVAAPEVNCDLAEEVGLAAMDKLRGKHFGDLHLSRGDCAVPILHDNEESKKKDRNAVNTFALFFRICRMGFSQADLQRCLQHELAALPPALFDLDKKMMRHNAKSDLVERLDSQSEALEDLSELDITATESLAGGAAEDVEQYTVLDGGYLLHVVAWPAGTYGDVCGAYVDHVKEKCSGAVTVVFDGYEVRWSTKDEEHRRRLALKGRRMCADVAVRAELPTTAKREEFLANPKNKTALIKLLSDRLRKANITVKQADADADVLVAETALSLDAPGRKVTVVANDTDILVVLVARATDSTNISVAHPGKALFDIGSIRRGLGDMTRCVLTAHAFSGCDTVSAIYLKGKKKAWDNIKADAGLREMAAKFTECPVDRESIAEYGECLMLSLYSKDARHGSLDLLRHREFNTKATKSVSKSPNLATFPPTSDATRQHSFRTYLQVQQWLGNPLDPTEWGWRVSEGVLEPVPMTLAVAPSELLQFTACGCTTGCKPGSRCSCRKEPSQACTAACKHCEGRTCSNTAAGDEEDFDFV